MGGVGVVGGEGGRFEVGRVCTSSFSSKTVKVSEACLRYSPKSAESKSTGKRKVCSNVGSLPPPADAVSCKGKSGVTFDHGAGRASGRRR